MFGLLIDAATSAATAWSIGAASSVAGTGVPAGGTPRLSHGVCQHRVARPKLRTPSVVTSKALGYHTSHRS